jgi:SAM-dependent methyltransferase
MGASIEETENGAEFDLYADSYEEAIMRGLSATGETRDYFAVERFKWLAHCLKGLGEAVPSVMDYGCGVALPVESLIDIIGATSYIGVDVSTESLDLARKRAHPSAARFMEVSKYEPCQELDLAYSSAVFHHIPRSERGRAAHYIFRALRPGGLFSFWEHNPLNPGTRYVMSRIPFDRGAQALWPWEGRRLLASVGFSILRMDYCFVFPRALKFLRAVEPLLRRVPIGGQYHVLGRKPGERVSAI